MQKIVWDFEAEGIPCRVEFEKNMISVNSAAPIKLDTLTKKANLFGTDYFIAIEGKEAVLHIRSFSAPVLSYDGKDCATGKKYIRAKVPVWAWVVILHAIYSSLLFCEGYWLRYIQVLVIALMASILLMTATISNPRISAGVRVLICVGIWLLLSVVEFAVVLQFYSG